MYVDLLERAVDDWVEDASDDELLDHVLACRLEMLIAVPRYAQNAYGALVAELAYDRSLIMLSTAHGIEAAPALFVRPGEERRRLEHALGGAGVDLTDLARRRRV